MSLVKKIIEAIRASDSKSKKRELEKTPSPRDKRKEKNYVITDFFHELSWARWQNKEIYFSSILLMLFTVIIYFAVFSIDRTVPIEVRPETNLKEALMPEDQQQVNQDEVTKFIINELTALYRIDDNGTPYFPLSRGYVSPEIYQEFDQQNSANMKMIKEESLIRALHIGRVLNILSNQKTGNIAAYVRGYLTIFKKPRTNRTTVDILPYRAKVILVTNIRNEANPTPFYMIELQVASQDQIEQWDLENQ